MEVCAEILSAFEFQAAVNKGNTLRVLSLCIIMFPFFQNPFSGLQNMKILYVFKLPKTKICHISIISHAF